MISRRAFESAQSRVRLGLLSHNKSYKFEAKHFLRGYLQAERARINSIANRFDEVSLNDVVRSGGSFRNLLASNGLPTSFGSILGISSADSSEKRRSWHMEQIKRQFEPKLPSTYNTAVLLSGRTGDFGIVTRVPDDNYAEYRKSLGQAYTPTMNQDPSIVRPAMYALRQRQFVKSDAKTSHELFPFSIENTAVNGENSICYFPAHIAALNENDVANWNAIIPIGASEAYYTYLNAERSFNIDVIMYAASNGEGSTEDVGADIQNTVFVESRYGIDDPLNALMVPVMSDTTMIKKLNFLSSCLRPSYSNDGYFSKAPFCKVRIGDIIKNRYVIFDNITKSYEPVTWNMKKDSLIFPKLVRVSLSFKVLNYNIGGFGSPSSSSDFYADRSI